MTECLILGQAGIGKTSLVAELVNRGCLAYCQRRASENRAARYPVDNSNEHKAWLMEVLPGLRIAWRALGIVVLDTTYISTSQVADRVTALVDLCAPAKT